MAMGAEPRRAANEGIVLGELKGVMSGYKLENLNFTNSLAANKWDLIENGHAPTPGRARNPGGVTQIAMQMTKARMGRNWKA